MDRVSDSSAQRVSQLGGQRKSGSIFNQSRDVHNLIQRKVAQFLRECSGQSMSESDFRVKFELKLGKTIQHVNNGLKTGQKKLSTGALFTELKERGEFDKLIIKAGDTSFESDVSKSVDSHSALSYLNPFKWDGSTISAVLRQFSGRVLSEGLPSCRKVHLPVGDAVVPFAANCARVSGDGDSFFPIDLQALFQQMDKVFRELITDACSGSVNVGYFADSIIALIGSSSAQRLYEDAYGREMLALSCIELALNHSVLECSPTAVDALTQIFEGVCFAPNSSSLLSPDFTGGVSNVTNLTRGLVGEDENATPIDNILLNMIIFSVLFGVKTGIHFLYHCRNHMGDNAAGIELMHNLGAFITTLKSSEDAFVAFKGNVDAFLEKLNQSSTFLHRLKLGFLSINAILFSILGAVRFSSNPTSSDELDGVLGRLSGQTQEEQLERILEGIQYFGPAALCVFYMIILGCKDRLLSPTEMTDKTGSLYSDLVRYSPPKITAKTDGDVVTNLHLGVEEVDSFRRNLKSALIGLLQTAIVVSPYVVLSFFNTTAESGRTQRNLIITVVYGLTAALFIRPADLSPKATAAAKKLLEPDALPKVRVDRHPGAPLAAAAV